MSTPKSPAQVHTAQKIRHARRRAAVRKDKARARQRPNNRTRAKRNAIARHDEE